jgi:hypothetical protein
MRQKTPKNLAIETLAYIRKLDGKIKELSFLFILSHCLEGVQLAEMRNYWIP